MLALNARGRVCRWVAVYASLFVLTNVGFSQAQSFYYKAYVRHAEGDFCWHRPPSSGYIAFRNRDLSVILTHQAPRLDGSSEPNIPGTGLVGAEFGHFAEVALGDSVYILFTCAETGEQALLSAQIDRVPWVYFPSTFEMRHVELPKTPEDVQLQRTEGGGCAVSWSAEPGVTYDVYRRSLADTLAGGQPRYRYERVAAGLTSGRYEDVGEDPSSWAYIVVPVSQDGVRGLPSPEATEYSVVPGLEIAPGATTALLRWRPTRLPSGSVVGYNIYRREEGQLFGAPIAYTGSETLYVDSRLVPGRRYAYRVVARSDAETEVARSEEIWVRTADSQEGFVQFATLRVAVVLYMNTNRGRIEEADLPWIRRMLERARLFIWRNSNLKLNLDLHILPIRQYREFPDPDDTAVGQTVDDLRALGVMNTQYDIIFRICPAVAGYWSYGVMRLNLPGPERATGFSHSEWPFGTGVLYPDREPSGLTWIFVHEVQHAIDALYDANGHPEMPHGDQPWNFPVPCGEHFDFQAKMLRYFRDYTDLTPEWGGIWESADADGDDFPDEDPLVPLDEVRFGSDPNRYDTDEDGYSDLQEATDGIYAGCNPLDSDTDGDGLKDGDDPYPRYPVRTGIPEFQPVVDGVIEADWPRICDQLSFTNLNGFRAAFFAACTSETLYLALDFSHYAVPVFLLDADGDGWWASRGNIELSVVPDRAQVNLRCWDGSPEARAYSLSRGGPGGMWDTEPGYLSRFGRRVLDPDSVRVAVLYEPPHIQLELAIPRSPYAGLSLTPGQRLRLNVRFDRVDHQPQNWASLFDLYDFVEFELRSATAVLRSFSPTIPSGYAVLPSYPNPAREGTVFTVQAPRSGMVEILIWDVRGRLVRKLGGWLAAPGACRLRWDGCDSQGVRVLPGIYLYQARVEGRSIGVGKIVFVR